MSGPPTIARDRNWADVFERVARAHEAHGQPGNAESARKAARKVRRALRAPIKVCGLPQPYASRRGDDSIVTGSCRYAFRAGKWPGVDSAGIVRCDDAGGWARCLERPHWDALRAESYRVGWPHAYRRDVFLVDYSALQALPSRVPFLWVLRECGSGLYPLTMPTRGETPWGAARSQRDAFGATRCRFYTWDGARLTEHRDAEEAAQAGYALAQAFGAGSYRLRPPAPQPCEAP